MDRKSIKCLDTTVQSDLTREEDPSRPGLQPDRVGCRNASTDPRSALLERTPKNRAAKIEAETWQPAARVRS